MGTEGAVVSACGGAPPMAAAPLDAALPLLRDGKHAHPYYWTPFVLMGDWR